MMVARILSAESFRQLIRFGVVGLTINAAGYGIYLVATWLGVPPKVVVSISYPLAVLISFLGNKRFTFRYKGGIARSGILYIGVQACGYALNMALLIIFVDKLHYPHQGVQAAAIFVVAAFTFLCLRLMVFKTTDRPGSSDNEKMP